MSPMTTRAACGGGPRDTRASPPGSCESCSCPYSRFERAVAGGPGAAANRDGHCRAARPVGVSPRRPRVSDHFGMRRSLLCAVAICAAAVAVAAAQTPPSGAQPRMWMGFHDDPVLRYGEERQAELGLVRRSHATVVRTIVDWSVVAPERPANAADPFSRAYHLDDLDEL